MNTYIFIYICINLSIYPSIYMIHIKPWSICTLTIIYTHICIYIYTYHCCVFTHALFVSFIHAAVPLVPIALLRLGFLLGRAQVDAHAHHGGILTRHGRDGMGISPVFRLEAPQKTQPVRNIDKHAYIYIYISIYLSIYLPMGCCSVWLYVHDYI